MLVKLWMLALTQFFVASSYEEQPHIRVEEGLLRGKWMTSRSGRRFLGFLKVPYAAPPIGELRFEVPQEPRKWEGIRDATEDGVICAQRNIFIKSLFFLAGEEDCLYLNVYTPKVNTTEDLLPVMVFFHGGAWVTGSGNSKYYPPEYLLDKDVVLVSIEYRLGPLGFLSMEDDELPGNLGLKDQVQSLRWIRKNIKAFGGNPDLVTIFGESAGGASVHYHLLSPMSRGLFHRAISQSGTGMCSWALGAPGVTRNNTIKLAKVLGCPSSPTADMIACLKQKPFGEIITTDVEFMVWNKDPMIPFKPVIEKSRAGFIPEHPEDATRKGRLAGVPWLTGVNSGEGAMGVAAFYDNEKLVKEFDQKFMELVPMIFFLDREKGLDVREAARQIRRFYFGGKPVDNSTVGRVVDLYTDAWFLDGVDGAVRISYEYAKAPVYYYYFSYRGSASFSSIFGSTKQDMGTSHADELIYLFPMERLFPDVKFSKKDEEFIRIFVQLWTNFARTGDPTPDGEEPFPEKWMPVRSDNLEYLHLAGEGPAMAANLLQERTAFWSLLRNSKNLRIRDEL